MLFAKKAAVIWVIVFVHTDSQTDRQTDTEQFLCSWFGTNSCWKLALPLSPLLKFKKF